LSIVAVLVLLSTPAAAAQDEPSFLHGAGQVVAGLLFELPKTVLDATLNGPPVVGTAVGLLGGVARALQTTVGGVVEMAAGFHPWGTR
jgi:hypothetical protein